MYSKEQIEKFCLCLNMYVCIQSQLWCRTHIKKKLGSIWCIMFLRFKKLHKFI